MKQLITIGILAILFTGCWDTRPMNNDGNGTANAYVQGSNPLYDPDYYYELDTWGSNADVFEFTPRSNTNYTCVNVGGASRALQCFPKPSKQ